MVDKLAVNDPRAQRLSTSVNGRTYSYLVANPPSGKPRDTVVLIHGFPDLALGWRYQVPFLVSCNLRVVVPDCLGYGDSDAPTETALYKQKTLADDLAAIVRHVFSKDDDPPSNPQVIVGGHDWGGNLAWRFGLWHRQLIKAIFVVCTPYWAPQKNYIGLADAIAAGVLKSFGYQLQFQDPSTERVIAEKGLTRQALSCLYGGTSADGRRAFTTAHGFDFDTLPEIQDPPTSFVSKEELDYYTAAFERHGFQPPLNWYRVREPVFQEERPLAESTDENAVRFTVPALFVTATNDIALTPDMSVGMDKYFDNLTRREVEASHWALTEKPSEVNQFIGEWLDTSVFPDGVKAAL